MAIDKEAVASMLGAAASLMEENAGRLSEIDSRFGDGDHGITIQKIAKLIREKLAVWDSASIRDFFDDLGSATMEVKGGSAGPLYGTLLGGLGVKLGEKENELDGGGVKRMFAGALSEMEEITTAKVGDKTMMDALIPAVDAAQAAEGEPKEILEAAAKAAEDGAKASEGFVSKFGRARSYKEQTIGTPDAGAVSTALFIRGLAKGLSSGQRPGT